MIALLAGAFAAEPPPAGVELRPAAALSYVRGSIDGLVTVNEGSFLGTSTDGEIAVLPWLTLGAWGRGSVEVNVFQDVVEGGARARLSGPWDAVGGSEVVGGLGLELGVGGALGEGVVLTGTVAGGASWRRLRLQANLTVDKVVGDYDHLGVSTKVPIALDVVVSPVTTLGVEWVGYDAQYLFLQSENKLDATGMTSYVTASFTTRVRVELAAGLQAGPDRAAGLAVRAGLSSRL